MLANRKWVITSFIEIKAKLKGNRGNKRQTTYAATCFPHMQYLRGWCNWQVVKYLAVTLHISSPESVRGWCVCVWGGGAGRGLDKRHHRRLYAPTHNHSIETVQQEQIFANDCKSSKLHSRQRQEKKRIHECLIFKNRASYI
jgi:hypothetical protein